MSTPGRPLRILHIDDEPVNLLVMEHLLRELGNEAKGVSSAEEALALLAVESFDLILTDIHMPHLTGMEFLVRLQEDGPPADRTPVVAVTADVMSRCASDYEKLGFAGALAKPLQVPEIERVLRAATESAGVRQFVGVGFSRASLPVR